MATVTLLVCDECGAQESVKHYQISEGGRRVVVDLCEAHSKWVEDHLGKAPKPSQKPRTNRTRAKKVTSMEEIEALKKSS